VAFEELYGALVLFRRFPRGEGSEIAAFAGLGIFLPGVEPKFAGWQLADHTFIIALPFRLRLKPRTNRSLRSRLCSTGDLVAGDLKVRDLTIATAPHKGRPLRAKATEREVERQLRQS
jgi:hypothetical protein